MPAPHACFVCGTAPGDPFFSTANAPTHANLLPATRDAALAVERAAIELALCPTCGLVFNVAFDPARMTYVEGYETSLFASAAFREYAAAQAAHLVDARGIRERTVLEIGCGRGEFLRLLCEAGANRAIGIDPSHAGTVEEFANGGRLEIIGDAYEEAWPRLAADLVLCRHVLEHLHEPLNLLGTVARAAAAQEGALVYFEVPDVRYTLDQGGIWDVIYEHCSYFTPVSLAHAFERAGLRPERVQGTYGGQFLTIEARAARGTLEPGARAAELEHLAHATRSFAETHAHTLARWSTELASLRANGKRAALWGAGSKGVTFVNAVDPDGAVIDVAVDGNTRKQGRFLPGTGQPIVAPADLAAVAPDVVIVTNPLYAEEIRRELRERGLTAEVRTA